MSYGPIRFLYNNLITSVAMITPGSQAPGVVGGVDNVSGLGTATAVVLGAFTGAEDLLYTIMIDDVSAGDSIGLATFCWKTSATVSGGEATGVTTSGSAITLNNGVSVYFVSSGVVDFALYDLKKFQATAYYGPGNLIDHDRNSYFRTGATMSLVINLGAPKEVTGCAIMGHNLIPATSTLTLESSANGSAWNAPKSFVVATERLSLYFAAETYQYWRLTATDGALTYFEIGELFLGTYLQLSILNADWGFQRGHGLFTVGDALASGVHRKKLFTSQQRWPLNFGIVKDTDMANILTMYQALCSTATGQIYPMFVHLFSDEADTLCYMDWANIDQFKQAYRSYKVFNFQMELAEQVKTRV